MLRKDDDCASNRRSQRKDTSFTSHASHSLSRIYLVGGILFRTQKRRSSPEIPNQQPGKAGLGFRARNPIGKGRLTEVSRTAINKEGSASNPIRVGAGQEDHSAADIMDRVANAVIRPFDQVVIHRCLQLLRRADRLGRKPCRGITCGDNAVHVDAVLAPLHGGNPGSSRRWPPWRPRRRTWMGEPVVPEAEP